MWLKNHPSGTFIAFTRHIASEAKHEFFLDKN